MSPKDAAASEGERQPAHRRPALVAEFAALGVLVGLPAEIIVEQRHVAVERQARGEGVGRGEDEVDRSPTSCPFPAKRPLLSVTCDQLTEVLTGPIS